MTWQVEQAITPSHAPSSGCLRRPGDVEQPLAGFGLDFAVERAVGLVEAHQGHAANCSCARAALSMRAKRVAQLVLAGVAAEAEPDRGARLAVAEAERAQHVARPARAAGAGGAERESDVAQVAEQARGVEAVAADVEIAVVALLGAAVERPVRPERLPGGGPQPFDMIAVARRSTASLAAAPKPTHSAGDSVPERSPRSCPPPWISGSGSAPVAHPQRADALGPVDLVRGDGDQVGPLRESARGRAPAPRRTASARRRRARACAISATGWMTPISLLTSIAATSSTRSSSARGKLVEVDQAVAARPAGR